MRYLFADCLLDTQCYLLRRAGQAIRLQPKVFEVLTYLLTHRDRVISKQELCEQIWSAQAASDATIENGSVTDACAMTSMVGRSSCRSGSPGRALPATPCINHIDMP